MNLNLLKNEKGSKMIDNSNKIFVELKEAKIQDFIKV